jgi:hypothetical protein
MAPDAAVEERGHLLDVAIVQGLGGMEARAREGGRTEDGGATWGSDRDQGASCGRVRRL